MITRAGVARLLVASGFFFVCSFFGEPPEGSFRVPARSAVPKIVRAPKVTSPRVAIKPVLEESPRDRVSPRWSMLPIQWETTPPAHLRTIDLVRQEAGEDLRPADFDAPNGYDVALSFLTDQTWALPSWLRATVKNFSTPSGSDLDINLFFHWDQWKIMVGIRNQTVVNGAFLAGYFPGMTMELYEFPIYLSRQPILFTSRLGLWSQPTDRTLGVPGEPLGVLGALTVEVPLTENLWLWLEGRGKSEGWVGDNEALGSGLGFKTGLHWSL